MSLYSFALTSMSLSDFPVVYFDFFFLNEALGSSLKKHGISFQGFAPILEKAFFFFVF